MVGFSPFTGTRGMMLCSSGVPRASAVSPFMMFSPFVVLVTSIVVIVAIRVTMIVVAVSIGVAVIVIPVRVAIGVTISRITDVSCATCQ